MGKEATGRTETVLDTVRRTDVDVEELDADDASVSEAGTSNTTTPRPYVSGGATGAAREAGRGRQKKSAQLCGCSRPTR